MEHCYLLSMYHIFLFSCRQLLFSPLYQFPEATVTNCKLGGLTQQKLLSYSSRGPKSKFCFTGPKSWFPRWHSPFRGSTRKSISCLIHLLVAASIFWLLVTSLQSSRPSFLKLDAPYSHGLLLCVCTESSSFSYKNSCDGILAFRVIPDNLSISKSLT